MLGAYDLTAGNRIGPLGATDFAVLLRTMIAGLLLVRRTDGEQEALSNGDTVMAATVLGLAAGFCGVSLEELETRLPRL